MTSANQTKLPLQPTLSVSIQTFFFKMVYNRIFFFKMYSQSFLTFYYLWCLEVSPQSIYCLVLFRNKLSMNQDLEISTSLLLCEMSNFVPFAHSSCIQIILSKTCQMLDKRRLRNLGESIIKRVLVVVAFQSSPGTPSQFLLDKPFIYALPSFKSFESFSFFFFFFWKKVKK